MGKPATQLGAWRVAHDTLVNVYLLLRKDPATGAIERGSRYPTRGTASKAARAKNKAMAIRQAKRRAALKENP